ncbi:MAG TPA: nicotinamide riboside transporter PnuC [Thermoanaerobaculia bacterium]|nr:nicotinamide riboside transporter PnuC [Thermoanaerobaculia bacterium]
MTADPVELTATIFGFVAVALTVKRHIACWPASLVQVSLYIWVFWKARLYSDMGLHVVYVALALYGWINWHRHGVAEGELVVERLTPRTLAGWGGAALAGTFGLGSLLAAYTDAALPFWDSSIAAMSLIAQWLTTRKVLENWLFWIAVDIVGIGVYLAKDLYPTALLYFVFLLLCLAGWREWRRAWRGRLAQPGH